MIKLGNGVKDARACVPLEMVLSIKTHETKTIEVSRSKTASAHERKVLHKLDKPLLEGDVKFLTTAILTPGAIYSDQQGVLYFAVSAEIFRNVHTDLGISVYRMPEYLVEVSRSNFGERNQLSM